MRFHALVSRRKYNLRNWPNINSVYTPSDTDSVSGSHWIGLLSFNATNKHLLDQRVLRTQTSSSYFWWTPVLKTSGRFRGDRRDRETGPLILKIIADRTWPTGIHTPGCFFHSSDCVCSLIAQCQACLKSAALRSVGDGLTLTQILHRKERECLAADWLLRSHSSSVHNDLRRNVNPTSSYM